MKKWLVCIVSLVLFLAMGFAQVPILPISAEEPPVSVSQDGILPDTWTAVDGLGRTLSGYEDVGTLRKDKTVGCFYWIWFNHWRNYEPGNITQIIAQAPDAQNDYNHSAWQNKSVLWWNEPLYGYYNGADAYVIRKHAELLADAGVDVIFFDCSNGSLTFNDSFLFLCKIFEEAKQDGVNVPKIAFLISFAAGENGKLQLRTIYKSLYEKERYKDLWFYWEGKPLIMGHAASLDVSKPAEKEIADFFTFRINNPLYFQESFNYSDKVWGWCSAYPQTKHGVRADGTVEQMTVSVAQNIRTNKDGSMEMVAQNDPRGGLHGRGWADGDYAYSYMKNGVSVTIDKDTKDAYLYGLNFQQQWDYALEVDPDFIFITGFNEWIAQRNREWQGTTNAFSDNFTDAYSRDIEPSKGVLKDHYYYQMVENIRRYKGVQTPPIATPESNVQQTIDIFASSDEWADVSLAYNHYARSTRERNISGAKGTHYENHTMRNDIITSKVAYDRENLYFMVETLEDLTASSDPAWMRLLLDTDPTGISKNWEGFEYVVNRVSPKDGKAVVERSLGGWKFEQVGTVSFSVSGKRLQIAIPRSLLGLSDTNDLSFNFKWTDNTREDGATEDSGDILDFYQYGDVAPGGRFMFSFMTSLPEPTTPAPDEPAPFGLPGYIWGIIAGGIVFVAAAALVCIVLVKKKAK
ncbi:MAG: hypothetical protein J6L76_04295 [Clostridia bacterium]|nr:hypothetical protein [Clostridia bacterium]